jgi:hypothetical protein
LSLGEVGHSLNVCSNQIVLRRRRRSVEAPTGRLFVRIGEVVFSGAIDYFRVGSPLPLEWRRWVRLR